jgi:predicted AlkP superfamily phosphohydrolase/phosphomutase
VGRVFIIGIDGAEPTLLYRWAGEGRLSNFRALLDRGAWGRLRSTIHPLTPQAWTSLITGVNPGRHGIFDFGKRARDSYQIELVTSRDRAAPAFWRFAPPGARVGVANVPLTWPPEPLPGFMVTGMHTPRAADGVWPPEILAELGDGYRIDVMAHWYEQHDRFLADLFAMHDARHAAFLRLMDHHRPDLSLLVYVAADRVQHALWGALTPAHLDQPGRQGDAGDSIFVTYAALDRALGDWLERVAPDDHLLVVSDHGFGDLRRDVYLNRVLIDAGLLRFDPAKVRAFDPPPLPPDADVQHTWMHRTAPSAEELPGDDDLIARGLCDVRRLNFETVDWSRTVAYSRGLCGNVWLNLVGREPEGVVTAAQIQDVRRRVREALSAVRDPDDGLPVVDRIVDKEEIYRGPCLDEAPDLLVIMRDYAYTTRGATEFWGREPVGPVVVGHTGNHRQYGVIMAAGPKIQPGPMPDADILDVLPTVFHLLDWPTPSDLDGRVVTEILRPAFRQVRYGAPTPAIVRDPRDFAAQEREAILAQLRALGYFG